MQTPLGRGASIILLGTLLLSTSCECKISTLTFFYVCGVNYHTVEGPERNVCQGIDALHPGECVEGEGMRCPHGDADCPLATYCRPTDPRCTLRGYCFEDEDCAAAAIPGDTVEKLCCKDYKCVP